MQLDSHTVDVLDQVTAARLKRMTAQRDLRTMGINPSDADIEHWLIASPLQKKRLTIAWLTILTSQNDDDMPGALTAPVES